MLDTSVDPNELIKQQYAAARKNLGYQKNTALDQANMQVDRNQAISGLSGGAALKAKQNAAAQVEQQSQEGETQLAGQEAQSKLQQSQFANQQNLEEQKFNESKSQFAQQMKYQLAELDENKKTNLVNAMIAIGKSGAFKSTPGEIQASGNVLQQFGKYY